DLEQLDLVGQRPVHVNQPVERGHEGFGVPARRVEEQRGRGGGHGRDEGGAVGRVAGPRAAAGVVVAARRLQRGAWARGGRAAVGRGSWKPGTCTSAGRPLPGCWAPRGPRTAGPGRRRTARSSGSRRSCW